MSKLAGGGDRGTTLGFLGCSTSVALATGPTDKEEEDRAVTFSNITG
jgi:hypothetical protein